ncbi:hypothetical protein V6N11_001345 [Hibiscus sabdariffa]|uniref:CCHC-type domain-containing protein n=1 Tax=Hibiscus sabdariffa TaxID=183260 RepID=A0ABR2S069_9ROSI
MTVKINLKKPLVSKIAINGQLQFVEYESLPMVCFKCGVYGHVSDSCAPIDGGQYENATTSAQKENPPKPPTPTPLAQGSRFNPIFMDNTAADDPSDQVVIQPEVEVATTAAVTTAVDPAIPYGPRESVVKAKTKGKATLLIRKPSATVLAPKNLNIMPRKSGSSVASSSRSKGRNTRSPLNPVSHGAVVISTKSAPVIPTQGFPQKRGTVRSESRV